MFKNPGLEKAASKESRAKAVETSRRNKAAAKVKRIAEGQWDDLSYKDRKSRVLIEQNNCCLSCGISEWNNLPIALHFDHIDGDNKNNARTNVRCICPNCHSQTETYAGRNVRLKRTKRS